MHDFENRPLTRTSPTRSFPLWIAIAVAMAMLMGGCGSSSDARPTEPASKVEPATTAPSPRRSATLGRPFGPVGGWIAYSSGDGIWALDPARPDRRIRLSRADGDPIAWSNQGKLLIRRAPPDPLGFSVLEPDGTETHLIHGAHDMTGGSFSPDGSEVVYAAGPSIYAVSSDGGASRVILRSTRRGASAYHPALSPEGTRIAYFDGMYDHSHTLWVANTDGTKRRVLLDDELSSAGHVRALTWSPDGEWLAFTTDGSLHVVRPDGTELRRVVSGGFATGKPAVQWSPDGSRIAYLRDGGGSCFSRTGKDEDFICETELVILNVYVGGEQVIGGIRTPENARIAWNPKV